MGYPDRLNPFKRGPLQGQFRGWDRPPSGSWRRLCARCTVIEVREVARLTDHGIVTTAFGAATVGTCVVCFVRAVRAIAVCVVDVGSPNRATRVTSKALVRTQCKFATFTWATVLAAVAVPLSLVRAVHTIAVAVVHPIYGDRAASRAVEGLSSQSQ